MPDRTFASLVPRVSASAPGCPQPTLVQHIRDAAIRACERSLAWRYSPVVFSLQPGVHQYFFEKPSGTEVHAVLGAQLNNSPLAVRTLEQALVDYPQWADLYNGLTAQQLWVASGNPSTFNQDPFNASPFNASAAITLPAAALEGASEPQVLTQVAPDQYVVLPLPDDAKPYRVRMFLALRPTRTATAMDEATFNELEDIIVHNALQHILLLPDSPWSSDRLATYHAKQYTSQITERRARANLGNARGILRVRFPPI